MAGGKYLQQKPPRGGRSSGGNSGRNFDNFDDQRNSGKKSGGKKTVLIILIVVLVLIIALAVACIIYYNSVLNMMSRPDDVSVPTLSEEELAELRGTVPVEMPTAPTETTSPEETWPEVVSDQNITNIMLIGQAARPGEEALIADTMILCSFNREQRTLTLTSLMRDLRLVWPEYIDINGKSHTGNNRINMAYNMGYRWAGNNVQGGMDVLESIVEYNFGVKVDHSVEINFESFETAMELMGGVDIELREDEIKYLQENYPVSNTGKTLKPGWNRLSPYLALGYARMRKVGHGDFERTERQRKVITSLLYRLTQMNVFEINKMFTTLLPTIVTDMTNEEITNLALEFIPMLKGSSLQSQRIPFDGTYSSKQFEIDGRSD